jgi:hypothetical protein
MSISPQIQTMVREFAARTGASAFPQLRRVEVAGDLLLRVDAPHTVAQGASSLCGSAAFLFNLIKANPMAYAKYVIDLYEKGDAWIGKLHVTPSAACKASNGKGVRPVDWISLASLRDSSNKAYTYSSAADEIAGITLPSTVTSWFHTCGYYKAVEDDTGLVYTTDLECLKHARNHWNAGLWPCLFVNAGILQPASPSTPNHWVVLLSDVLVDGKPLSSLKSGDHGYTKTTSRQVKFRVFSWGGVFAVDMPVKSFVQYFYGFVVPK